MSGHYPDTMAKLTHDVDHHKDIPGEKMLRSAEASLVIVDSDIPTSWLRAQAGETEGLHSKRSL